MGSKASRKPSPNRLRDRTISEMTTAGMNDLIIEDGDSFEGEVIFRVSGQEGVVYYATGYGQAVDFNGLDFNEGYRNLPYVGILKPECYA